MKIVIVGAGGHGRVVLDIFRSNHQFEVVGFLDANPHLHHQKMDGVEILGDLSMIPKFGELGIGGGIIAVGDNRIRQTYAETFEKAGVSLISAIHPSASIADNAQVGKNVVIAAGANICAHVQIDDSAILNTGSLVDHESHISMGVHICPGVRLAGHVKVKQSAFVGIGATIIQNITIGEAAVVGAGTVVINDVPAYTTVVGVPAKIVKPSHVPVADRRIEVGAVDRVMTRPLITRPVRRRPQQPALQ
jgi:sugar O-acyltransferase (sialic acid O-acetyltransferase NeuD family)